MQTCVLWFEILQFMKAVYEQVKSGRGKTVCTVNTGQTEGVIWLFETKLWLI